MGEYGGISPYLCTPAASACSRGAREEARPGTLEPRPCLCKRPFACPARLREQPLLTPKTPLCASLGAQVVTSGLVCSPPAPTRPALTAPTRAFPGKSLQGRRLEGRQRRPWRVARGLPTLCAVAHTLRIPRALAPERAPSRRAPVWRAQLRSPRPGEVEVCAERSEGGRNPNLGFHRGMLPALHFFRLRLLKRMRLRQSFLAPLAPWNLALSGDGRWCWSSEKTKASE